MKANDLFSCSKSFEGIGEKKKTDKKGRQKRERTYMVIEKDTLTNNKLKKKYRQDKIKTRKKVTKKKNH